MGLLIVIPFLVALLLGSVLLGIIVIYLFKPIFSFFLNRNVRLLISNSFYFAVIFLVNLGFILWYDADRIVFKNFETQFSWLWATLTVVCIILFKIRNKLRKDNSTAKSGKKIEKMNASAIIMLFLVILFLLGEIMAVLLLTFYDVEIFASQIRKAIQLLPK